MHAGEKRPARHDERDVSAVRQRNADFQVVGDDGYAPAFDASGDFQRGGAGVEDNHVVVLNQIDRQRRDALFGLHVLLGAHPGGNLQVHPPLYRHRAAVVFDDQPAPRKIVDIRPDGHRGHMKQLAQLLRAHGLSLVDNLQDLLLPLNLEHVSSPPIRRIFAYATSIIPDLSASVNRFFVAFVALFSFFRENSRQNETKRKQISVARRQACILRALTEHAPVCYNNSAGRRQKPEFLPADAALASRNSNGIPLSDRRQDFPAPAPGRDRIRCACCRIGPERRLAARSFGGRIMA